MYKFAPACEQETIVFGAARPGYSDQEVYNWIEFMRQQNIKRVCCLLSNEQLAGYSHLLSTYQQEFGNQQVCWAAIADFHLADLATLTEKILPFLIEADKLKERVVVHCSGGIGRTGHVLAAWLVCGRGFANQDAIAAVKCTGRNPHEAVIAAVFQGKNPLTVAKELDFLLNNCRILT
ncbi:dual specificity protein phosphatase [Trichormus variabilis ATCC 29413]|uniref:Dual specificity protein phosphatase n=2 Tax=Anabaena variabilis TaxID=264691 RepID=Q3MCX4_TRIV2|nr:MULTISPECIES: dual specificity protein phosphatase family protein [Nostocaceae]ABA21162.1 dual specificity protein phosphatase [Trichormus variabilis ATCC 29413]MBC1213777.1 dual specificity protein phosphatase family protein [Trichormus variabilis ARAD]MBC1254769.1 dual specificity protein phosphatase family protein [Trichormus variabilis V5]MBC1266950.1 dual specificity protein phosphatase family protein [Trichormus variabilis FSR]MBC1301500.1 dual specificity protein phosphatase family p